MMKQPNMSFKATGEAANYGAYLTYRNNEKLLITRTIIREALHSINKLYPPLRGNVDAIYLATILSWRGSLKDLKCKPAVFFMTSTASRSSLFYPSLVHLNKARLRFLSPIENGECDIKWNQRYLRKKQNQLRQKLKPDWSLRRKFARALYSFGIGLDQAKLISLTYPLCYLEGASFVESDLKKKFWCGLPDRIDCLDSTLWSFSANPWAQSLLTHQHIRLCYHQHGTGSEFLPSLPGFIAEKDGCDSFIHWGLGSINARPFRFKFTSKLDNSNRKLQSVLLLGLKNPETDLPYDASEIIQLVEVLSCQSKLTQIFIHPLSTLRPSDFPSSINAKIQKGISPKHLRKENLHFILDSNLHTLLYFCISNLKPFDILGWKSDQEVHRRVNEFKTLLIDLKLLHNSQSSVRLSGCSSKTETIQSFLYGTV